MPRKTSGAKSSRGGRGHDATETIPATVADLRKIFSLQEYWVMKECLRVSDSEPLEAVEAPSGNAVFQLTCQDSEGHDAVMRVWRNNSGMLELHKIVGSLESKKTKKTKVDHTHFTLNQDASGQFVRWTTLGRAAIDIVASQPEDLSFDGNDDSENNLTEAGQMTAAAPGPEGNFGQTLHCVSDEAAAHTGVTFTAASGVKFKKDPASLDDGVESRECEIAVEDATDREDVELSFYEKCMAELALEGTSSRRARKDKDILADVKRTHKRIMELKAKKRERPEREPTEETEDAAPAPPESPAKTEPDDAVEPEQGRKPPSAPELSAEPPPEKEAPSKPAKEARPSAALAEFSEYIENLKRKRETATEEKAKPAPAQKTAPKPVAKAPQAPDRKEAPAPKKDAVPPPVAKATPEGPPSEPTEKPAKPTQDAAGRTDLIEKALNMLDEIEKTRAKTERELETARYARKEVEEELEAATRARKELDEELEQARNTRKEAEGAVENALGVRKQAGEALEQLQQLRKEAEAEFKSARTAHEEAGKARGAAEDFLKKAERTTGQVKELADQTKKWESIAHQRAENIQAAIGDVLKALDRLRDNP